MSAIKPGDTVMVVRGHPCALGETFIVGSIIPKPGEFVELACSAPGCSWRVETSERCAFDEADGTAAPLSWLMRVDPSPAVAAELSEAA